MKVIAITVLDKTLFHYVNPLIDGYTLCGIDSVWGPNECTIMPESIEGKITCPDCVAVINHCKGIRAKDIKSR
jgi:hypothetical protein